MSEAIASILSSSSDTARMRLLASNGDESVNDEVLRQFEALFLQQMLKSMRTASLGEGLFQSDQSEFYRDMYDQQIATDLASKEIVGIANLINRQLGLNQQEANTLSDGEKVNSTTRATVTEQLHPVQSANLKPFGDNDFNNTKSNILSDKKNINPILDVVKTIDDSKTEHAQVVQPSVRPLAFKPNSPQEFVDYAYAYSQPAAKRLGVDADVIIAIAALETGWGNHLPTDDSGSSNNYFGIKADGRWYGEKVQSETLEFERGVFNKLQQPFRAYQNLGESFNDFAEFVLGNERYSKAVEFAHDTVRFLQEIQKAGYATDPKYADKILNVLNNKAFTGIGK